jgi:hypothetical protein
VTIERWVYIGPCTLVGGKPGQEWFALGELDAIDESKSLVFAKLTKSPHIGSIYEVNVTRTDERISAGAGKRVGTFSDRTKVAEWSVRAQAFDTMRAASKHAKTLPREALEEALRPIVRAMTKTNYEGRRAILVLVLQYLDRHGG